MLRMSDATALMLATHRRQRDGGVTRSLTVLACQPSPNSRSTSTLTSHSRATTVGGSTARSCVSYASRACHRFRISLRVSRRSGHGNLTVERIFSGREKALIAKKCELGARSYATQHLQFLLCREEVTRADLCCSRSHRHALATIARASAHTNALWPVIARPTTSAVISFVPSYE